MIHSKHVHKTSLLKGSNLLISLLGSVVLEAAGMTFLANLIRFSFKALVHGCCFLRCVLIAFNLSSASVSHTANNAKRRARASSTFRDALCTTVINIAIQSREK